MKMTLSKTVILLLSAMSLNHAALAADRGTPDDAIALVKKAVAYMKASGKDKAFAEFSSPTGQFRDRDLYIFVIDMNGKELAHGSNPKLIGKNLIDLKDAEGKAMVRSFIDVANTKGKGWVDYKWPDPVKNTIEQKSTYLEKHDDVLVASGIYK